MCRKLIRRTFVKSNYATCPVSTDITLLLLRNLYAFLIARTSELEVEWLTEEKILTLQAPPYTFSFRIYLARAHAQYREGGINLT
jgi:hypothetical protein